MSTFLNLFNTFIKIKFMKKILIPFVFLFIFLSCGGEPKYINIIGSRILIAPPDGFEQKTNFVGLKKDGNTGIEAYDYSGSYYKYLTLYTKEEFESRGVKVYSHEDTKIAGYAAKIAHIQFDQTISAYIVVFGDTSFCAAVIGSYVSSDKETGDAIKKALTTVKYDSSIKLELEKEKFTIDDRNCIFKLAKFSPTESLYAINGIAKSNYGLDPYVLTHLVPAGQDDTPETIVNIMNETLAKYGFENLSVQNQTSVKINNYDAYQCEVHCLANGQNAVIYNSAISNGNYMLTIQGYSYSDFEKNLLEFKKLGLTLKFNDQ